MKLILEQGVWSPQTFTLAFTRLLYTISCLYVYKYFIYVWGKLFAADVRFSYIDGYTFILYLVLGVVSLRENSSDSSQISNIKWSVTKAWYRALLHLRRVCASSFALSIAFHRENHFVWEHWRGWQHQRIFSLYLVYSYVHRCECIYIYAHVRHLLDEVNRNNLVSHC